MIKKVKSEGINIEKKMGTDLDLKKYGLILIKNSTWLRSVISVLEKFDHESKNIGLDLRLIFFFWFRGWSWEKHQIPFLITASPYLDSISRFILFFHFYQKSIKIFIKTKLPSPLVLATTNYQSPPPTKHTPQNPTNPQKEVA